MQALMNAVDQEFLRIDGRVGDMIIADKAASKRHQGHFQLSGNFNPSLDEVNAPFSTGGFNCHHGGFMGPGWSEKMGGGRNTGGSHPGVFKFLLYLCKIFIGDLERVKLIAVKSKFNSCVAGLIYNVNCIQKIQSC